MSSEIWKDIPGYEGWYQVSSAGRVRSIDRTVYYSDGRVRHFKGVTKRQYYDHFGYPKTTLNRNSADERIHIHVLVALAFLGPRPEGMQICHNNGDPNDPRPENLRYDTVSANHADKVKHGTSLRGERGSNSKLTTETVLKIRQLRGQHTCVELARMFDTSPAHVCNIQKRARWGHL